MSKERKRIVEGSHPESESLPFVFRVVKIVLDLPRLIRIGISAVFAIATTMAIREVVDEIYLNYFFSESTRIIPSLVTAAVGLLMYVIGWQLIVGTLGEDRQAKVITAYYLLIGVFAMMLVVLWVVRLSIINSI